jgi:hypothetical protein
MPRVFLNLYRILLIGFVLTLIVVIGASSHGISLKNRENIFILFSIIIYLSNLILLFLFDKIKRLKCLLGIFHCLALGTFVYLFIYFIIRHELSNVVIFLALTIGVLFNTYIIIYYKLLRSKT